MNLIFIGDEFYAKSGTAMSSLYELKRDGSLSRSDWGKVQIALKNGQEVHIRPATDDELGWAYRKLESMLP